MSFADQLIHRLKQAEGDTQAQAAIAAEFVLTARPEHEREQLFAALDAAAVLRWFDATLLAKLLEVPEDVAQKGFESLKPLPFVEKYPAREGDVRNIHEATRVGWRKRLARESPEHFRALSGRAADWFANNLTAAARVEWIYHLLSADPNRGASTLEALDREWSGGARPEDRNALAAALKEIEDTKLVVGRARAWVLLCIAWTRAARGETARLADTSSEALSLARAVHDHRAEGDAQCLWGDVLEAQGKLEEAQAAFEENLAIGRRLVEQDPSNTGWQRELGVAHSRIGEVLQAQGKLEAAQAAFKDDLAIIRRLAEQDPSNTGWQRDLAAAHNRMGGVLEAQRKLEAAQAAFEEALSISRRLAEQDPGNAGWQRDLGAAHNRMGAVMEAQGRLEAAQAAFEEDLAISRRLAEQDPSNAAWQRDLGTAHNQIGGVLEAQGKLEAAQAAFGGALSISRRLAEQSPSNAAWQRDLGVALVRLARRWQRDETARAVAAYREALRIFDALIAVTPGVVEWHRARETVARELAAAESER